MRKYRRLKTLVRNRKNNLKKKLMVQEKLRDREREQNIRKGKYEMIKENRSPKPHHPSLEAKGRVIQKNNYTNYDPSQDNSLDSSERYRRKGKAKVIEGDFSPEPYRPSCKEKGIVIQENSTPKPYHPRLNERSGPSNYSRGKENNSASTEPYSNNPTNAKDYYQPYGEGGKYDMADDYKQLPYRYGYVVNPYNPPVRHSASYTYWNIPTQLLGYEERREELTWEEKVMGGIFGFQPMPCVEQEEELSWEQKLIQQIFGSY